MAPQNPEPYVAVALQPSFRGVTHRRDIKQNIDSIHEERAAYPYCCLVVWGNTVI